MHVSTYKNTWGKRTQKSCTSEHGGMKFPNLRDVVLLEFWKLTRSLLGSPHRYYYHTHMQDEEWTGERHWCNGGKDEKQQGM